MIKIEVEMDKLQSLIQTEVQKAMKEARKPLTWISFKAAKMMLEQANTRSSYHTLKNLVKLGTVAQQGRKVCREELESYIKKLT